MELKTSPSLNWRIVEYMANHGFSVARCVDVDRVERLINRLHPITTDKELIRLGSMGDGGYLVPDDLDGIVACFSPGVSTVATFEEAIVQQGIPCYLADASVSGAPVDHPLIHFDKKFLGVINDHSTITLDSMVRAYAPISGDLILQMDIEGAEWPVLLNVSDSVLGRFRIIVLELHSLERLIDKVGFDLMSAVLDRLLRQFNVVHLHPNNNSPMPLHVDGLVIPRLLEMTLLRRDRGSRTGFAKQFPHPLDHRNLVQLPDFPLPAGWYRGGE